MKTKNILIYCSVVLWKHHFKGMLQIVNNEIKKKNTVYLLSCDGTVESCPPNNPKIKTICGLCQNFQKTIYENLIKKNVRIIKLNLNIEKNYKKFNFKSYNEFKNFRYDNVPLGVLVTSDLATKLRDSLLNYDEVKDIAIQKLKTSISLYEKTINVINEYNIDQVYSWNGRRGSDGPVLYAAKKLKKSFFSYITSSDAKYLAIKKSLIVNDLKIMHREIHGVDLKKIFKSKKKIENFVKRSMNSLSKGIKPKKSFKNFSYYKKKNYDIFTYKKKKKLITIFTSTLWEYVSLGPEWNLKFDNKNYSFLALLEKIINNKYILKNHEIIIKWHPNHVVASENELKKIDNFIKRNNHVHHYKYYENISIYDLINISDNVITMSSTAGIEYSYIKSKKLILLGPSNHENLEFVKKCKNMRELIWSLNQNLKLKKSSIYDFGKFMYWTKYRPSKKLKNINFPLKSKIWLIMIIISSILHNKSKKLMNFLYNKLKINH